MAQFRHPSLLDLIEKYGIPRYQFNRNLAEFADAGRRILVVYHKSGCPDDPVSGAVGSMGICNVWGRFLFPRPCADMHVGAYVRLPRQAKALLRELIADQTRERGPVRYAPASGGRFIDLRGDS